MNADSDFRLSHTAFNLLYDAARSLGLSPARAFRQKAYLLAYAERPTFNLSGQPLTKCFVAGLNEDVYVALVSLADQLNVPRETIGELVCAYVEDAHVPA